EPSGAIDGWFLIQLTPRCVHCTETLDPDGPDAVDTPECRSSCWNIGHGLIGGGASLPATVANPVGTNTSAENASKNFIPTPQLLTRHGQAMANVARRRTETQLEFPRLDRPRVRDDVPERERPVVECEGDLLGRAGIEPHLGERLQFLRRTTHG